MREKRTCCIGGVNDDVLVLDILDNAADQALGAIWRRVDRDKLEGTSGGHGEIRA